MGVEGDGAQRRCRWLAFDANVVQISQIVECDAFPEVAMARLLKYRNQLVVGGLLLLEAIVGFTVAGLRRGGEPTSSAGEQSQAPAETDPGLVEVPLGEFTVQNRVDPKAPVRVVFRAVAVVAKERRPGFDETFKLRQFRVQEAIVAVVRTAREADVMDGELTNMKRAIQSAVAREIGPEKPFVESIVLPEFKVDRT